MQFVLQKAIKSSTQYFMNMASWKPNWIAELQIKEWFFSLVFHKTNFNVLNQAIDPINEFLRFYKRVSF